VFSSVPASRRSAKVICYSTMPPALFRLTIPIFASLFFAFFVYFRGFVLFFFVFFYFFF